MTRVGKERLPSRRLEMGLGFWGEVVVERMERLMIWRVMIVL